MLIRYYFDEHIFADAATALRHRHIDALTTAEAGNLRASDQEQLAHAAAAAALRQAFSLKDGD